MPRKTKAQIIAETPIEKIVEGGKKNIGRVQKAVSTLRTGFHRRQSAIYRSGEFSHALYQYEHSLPIGYVEKPVKSMSWNELLHELSRLQSFFLGKTSDIKGIRKFNMEQDKRIFGYNADGSLTRLTKDERKKYWDVYNEYMAQNPNREFESGQIQRVFGMATTQQQVDDESSETKFIDFLHTDFDEVNKEELFKRINKMYEDIKTKQALEEIPNVFRGQRRKGPFVK